MKTNKFLVMALLLGLSGASFTSCAIKDNEKTVEIVEDPIKASTEYYINGKVVDSNGKNLSGVTVKAQDGTSVTTANDGSFSITVKATGSYSINAKKTGYLEMNSTVNIPNNATNRASYNTSFIMAAKAADITIQQTSGEVILSTATNNQVQDATNINTGLIVTIPQNTTGATDGTTISMTEYVPEVQVTASNEAPVANLYIETSKAINAGNVTIAIANPVENVDEAFETLSVYKSTATRSGDGFIKVGDAELKNNKYTITLTNGNLAGDYSFRVKYTSSKTMGKDTNSGEKDNSGSLNAIKDYKISYEDKMGWEFTDKSQLDKSDQTLQNMIITAVKSCLGVEGVTKTTKSLTTNISGNSILYYTIENNYTTTTYTFKLKGNKNILVKAKAYTDTKVNYEIASADQHSGGTSVGL